MSLLKERLIRAKEDNNWIDPDYIWGLLCSCPEGQWFAPTNKHEHLYSICDALFHEHHLLCKKIVPILKNGLFTGNKVYFLYKSDLDYSNI